MKLPTAGRLRIPGVLVILLVACVLGGLAGRSLYHARIRSAAEQILDECRQVDAALDQYALKNSPTGTNIPNWSDLTPYLKPDSGLLKNGNNDSLGNPIAFSWITIRPQVSPKTKAALSAVVENAFWGPYS